MVNIAIQDKNADQVTTQANAVYLIPKMLLTSCNPNMKTFLCGVL